MRKVLFGILLFTTLLFSGCTDTPQETSNKTTPIYQGMQLSREQGSAHMPESLLPTRLNRVLLTSSEEDQIVEKARTMFGSMVSENVDFYAQKNETLYITVNIFNPDSLEILSFTLNGYKYQSYQFEDGSDSETLVLEVNSGDISGIQSFTIDQIKYVDGTEIKDVIIDGYKTVKLGVEYEDVPAAVVSNVNVGTTFISFDVDINDQHGLITGTGSNAIAVLYDGSEIIQKIDLGIGQNQVLFENISSMTNYQYAIIAPFDLMDGFHAVVRSLDYSSFTTNSFIEITNVAPQQETIEFDVNITDIDAVGMISSIELYQGETLVTSLTDVTVRRFDGLLSNTEYTIKVQYSYDLNDGVGEQIEEVLYTVLTLEKQDPTIEINNVAPQQETIDFDVSITDIDAVGMISSIELYQGETLFTSLTDVTVRRFDGLLSNTEYTIKVQYSYDLNDGVGEQIEEVLYTVWTIHHITIDSIVTSDINVTNSLVQLEVILNNPGGYEIGEIVIDGEIYNNIFLTEGNTKAFIQVGPFSEAGVHDLSVDEIRSTINGVNSVHEVDFNFVINTIYNMEVTGMTSNIQDKYVHFGNDLSIVITIDNIHLFDIESVVISDMIYQTEDVVIDGTNLVIPLNVGIEAGVRDYVLSEINTIQDGEVITYDYSGGMYRYVVYVGDTTNINYVSSVSELINLDMNGINILSNNIDLSNVDWTAIGDFSNPFSGALFGNGFEVSNLSITQTSSTRFHSLFGKLDETAYIYDLHMRNVMISINDMESIGSYAAGLVAYNYGVLEKTSTSGTIENRSNGVGISSGGLVTNNHGVILESYSHTNITTEKLSAQYESFVFINTGGLVGGNMGTIINSYSIGDVQNNDYTYNTTYHELQGTYAGGLVGRNRNGAIFSSYSIGDVSVSSLELNARGGLLVGSHLGVITDSFAVGDVEVTSDQYASIGYIIGRISIDENQENIIKNTYVLNEQILINGSSAVNIVDSDIVTFIDENDLNNIDWYVSSLHFNDLVWDLQFVDQNMMYPTIK